METQLITRIRNGKKEQFERKAKEKNKDTYISMRFNSKTKEQLIKFAKDNNYKSYSELVEELIEDLLSKNGYKE